MDVLDLIKPNQKEESRANKIVCKFIEKLNKRLIAAEAVVGGSFAKDTWLKGDHDIDVFAIFSKKYDSKKIPEMLGKLLKKLFFFVKKVNGSRDYFQVRFNGYLFEVIPVIKIDSPD